MRNLEKRVSMEGKVMRSPSQVRIQLDLFVNGLGMCLNGALEVFLGLSWLLDACKELWMTLSLANQSKEKEDF